MALTVCHFYVICSCFPVLWWRPGYVSTMCGQPDAVGQWFSGPEWRVVGGPDPGSVFGHTVTNRKSLQTSHTAPLPPFVYNGGWIKFPKTKLYQCLLLQLHFGPAALTLIFQPAAFASQWILIESCLFSFTHHLFWNSGTEEWMGCLVKNIKFKVFFKNGIALF